MTATFARTKVLFIGGEGRSGSTVLERLIAAQPQTCGVGELKNLFERGVRDRELCGCGEPVPDCEMWSEVGRRLVGGWNSTNGSELIELFAKINKRSRLPWLVLGRGKSIRRARSVVADLYSIISELTGSPVIIDSSKHPSWAYLVAGTDAVDLRVVHLVRHPSGVVQSWSRPVGRPQAGDDSEGRVMSAHSAFQVAIRWNIFNGLFQRLARRLVPTVLVRYEEYVENLEETLRACMGLMGLEYDGQPIAMSTGHGIAGNPSRFADGGEKIEVDTRWVSQLGAIKHIMVSAITWRKRAAYGYRFRRSSPVRPVPRHADQGFVDSAQPAGESRSGDLEPTEHE